MIPSGFAHRSCPSSVSRMNKGPQERKKKTDSSSGEKYSKTLLDILDDNVEKMER